MIRKDYCSPETILVPLSLAGAVLQASPTGEGFGEPEEFGGF